LLLSNSTLSTIPYWRAFSNKSECKRRISFFDPTTGDLLSETDDLKDWLFTNCKGEQVIRQTNNQSSFGMIVEDGGEFIFAQSGFGGIVSFEIKGGREAAFKVINATEILSITANLGDTKTTITHPASTTHGRLTDDEKQQANITEGLIRISVGLEDIGDVINDISKGL